MVNDRTNTRIGDEWVSYSIDLHRYAELHAFLQLQTHDAQDDESNAEQPPDESGLMEPDDALEGIDWRQPRRTAALSML